jgi:hypothetical protein
MRNKLINITRAAALAVCAFTATQAHATSLPNVAMSVPFDFVVSGKTLPAGAYMVARVNGISPVPAFVIRNVRTHTASIAVMSVRSRNAADKAEVVFNCSDNKCYLCEMKITGVESYIAPVPRNSQKERVTSIALRPTINAD